MSVNQLKINYLAKKAQVVLFTSEGGLIESCDTLIDVTKLTKQSSLFEAFPMLESLQSNFNLLNDIDNELYFPRVEFSYNDKEWVFDFTFYKKNDAKGVFIWLIQDLTRQYRYLFDVQQERNESIVKEELRKAQSVPEILQRDIEYLNRILRLKLDYFTKLTYDIKNPVQDIYSTAVLLKEHIKTNEGEAYLHALSSSVHLLNTMLDDMLELSQLDIAKTPFENKLFLLPEVLWAVIKTYDYTSHKQNVTVKLNVDTDVVQKLWGDAIRLSQIMYNLLHNAFKNVSKGGRILVNVHLIEKKDNEVLLKFVVKDNGKGMSNEVLQKLFHEKEQPNALAKLNEIPFYKNNMGLIITRQLVNLQKGTIEIDNVNGKGTQFSVVLSFNVEKNLKK